MRTANLARLGALAALALASEACASAGPTGSTETPSLVSYTGTGGRGALTLTTTETGVGETAYQESPAAIWALLPGLFQTLGIEATVIDRGNGVMGNPGFRARRIEDRRLSTYIDCGSGLTGDYADTYQVDMMVRIELISNAPGSTTVRTTIDAYAQDRNTSGNPVHCRSRGNLERRVGALLTERLAA